MKTITDDKKSHTVVTGDPEFANELKLPLKRVDKPSANYSG